MNNIALSNEQSLESVRAVIQLSVVIVNWNTRDLLLQCLHSLDQDDSLMQEQGVEIFVVDNGSSDGSVEAVQRHFPDVRVIENTENAGFAHANNQAIRACGGQHVLLLNSDTEVLPGALPRLVQFMEDHPDAGGVGARLLNADRSLQTSCFPFPTVLKEFWHLLHLDRVWPYAEYRMDKWEQDEARAVDVLLGACLLLRRDALDEVGLLDEIFFMYSEEVDLCYRLKQAGWGLYWVPGAQIIHYGGQSAAQMAPKMFLQLYRSKILYFQKHYGMRTAQLYKLTLFIAALPRILIPIPQRLLPSTQKQRQKIGGNYWRLIRALPNL